MDIQLRKGLMEYCILSILEKNDSYGYQIMKDISPYIDISESALYSTLRKMEELGFVTFYTEEYNNRLRKYFHLSDKGHDYLNAFRGEADQLIKILDFIGRQVE